MKEFSVSWAENEILVQEYTIYSIFFPSLRGTRLSTEH